ncbi:GNAT family N-acetyltransferase [Streptomyces sp. NBC_00536]|uniref:GNAT family N-acetyltransferase n=1 Tax=Streptomyces sp. NBC_00536 TaxID=2975769 RepID=UPI002E810012|nr:GNAT family N-acetyltransferase [Streptomyces sp. NBC_00536]WUC78106.1 GNAT family N-acetyltransferase [Streptomyces sp. NBC_00536]
MTTTLRPSAPLQHSPSGARSRPYEIRVNSRRVGALLLTAAEPLGSLVVGKIQDLSVDEPDRRRGRATVAGLAAEEVLRSWGCRRVTVSVPADSDGGLRLAAVLGYARTGRNMVKDLAREPVPLPAGITGRPITAEEYGPWLAAATDRYAGNWEDRGLSPEAAHAKSVADHAGQLPQGPDTPGVDILVLEAAGIRAGHIWIGRSAGQAYVFDVEVAEDMRGRGHGRSLMLLAEGAARAAGLDTLGLHVFAGNTPAERLYESLGYRTTLVNFAKELV